MEVKLRKVGNSIDTSFPKQVLDRLGLVEGDTVNLVVNDNGIELVIHDPNFDKMIETYQLGDSQYRNPMGELFKQSENEWNYSIGICRRRQNFSKFGNLRSYPYSNCDFGFRLNWRVMYTHNRWYLAMPLDPKEFEKVFANHFETIAPEQFLDNLKAACPYLFDEDSSKIVEVSNGKEADTKLIVLTDDKAQHSSWVHNLLLEQTHHGDPAPKWRLLDVDLVNLSIDCDIMQNLP